METLQYIKNCFFFGIIWICIFCVGPIIVIFFCMQLLWEYYRAPSHETTIKDLCDDVLRAARSVSYEQDIDARWISEGDIIMRIERTYHTKKFVQNRTKAIHSIICYWVNLGILDTKTVEINNKSQFVYAVSEKRIKELYEC